jgi:hypothetical protein
VASSAAQRGGKESDAPDENRDFPALWAWRFLAAVKNAARPAFNPHEDVTHFHSRLREG